MLNYLEDKFNTWRKQITEKYPQINLWEQTHDQTHITHTLITLLLFGMIGMLVFGLVGIGMWLFATPMIMGIFGLWLFGTPLAMGILGGLLYYFSREIRQRYSNPEWKAWDSILDILVPFMVLGPFMIINIWVISTPKIGLMLYLIGTRVMWMYSIGRPHILHYDKWKDVY